MIEASNINYRINKTKVIKDLSFSANRGEVIGIIGRSGSGKSALLKILNREISDYEGTLHFDNSLYSSFTKRIIIQSIAYYNNIIPHNNDDTVLNFITMARLINKIFFQSFSNLDLEETDRYIRLFELEKYINLPLKKLSDAVLKTVMLAYTFNKNSPVVILDNPTESIDLKAQLLLHKVLKKYTLDGESLIIIASHDLNFILQTVDRIIIMEKGAIALELKPTDFNQDIAKKYFDVEVMISKNIYNGKPEIHFFSYIG